MVLGRVTRCFFFQTWILLRVKLGFVVALMLQGYLQGVGIRSARLSLTSEKWHFSMVKLGQQWRESTRDTFQMSISVFLAPRKGHPLPVPVL